MPPARIVSKRTQARPPNGTTVAIPVYNTERFLDACLRSVLDQTERPAEIIAADDGSADSSGGILGGHADHVRVVRKPNGGAATALNKAARAMEGDRLNGSAPTTCSSRTPWRRWRGGRADGPRRGQARDLHRLRRSRRGGKARPCMESNSIDYSAGPRRRGFTWHVLRAHGPVRTLMARAQPQPTKVYGYTTPCPRSGAASCCCTTAAATAPPARSTARPLMRAAAGTSP